MLSIGDCSAWYQVNRLVERVDRIEEYYSTTVSTVTPSSSPSPRFRNPNHHSPAAAVVAQAPKHAPPALASLLVQQHAPVGSKQQHGSKRAATATAAGSRHHQVRRHDEANE